jgi:hypothetical protein
VPQRIFIASSTEGLPVANEVKALLDLSLIPVAESFIWNSGTFELTRTYIEALEKELNKADFAVMVLTQDDQQHMRAVEQFVPRDNVVFELGLFVGKLGRDRVFYLQPQNVKIPSDLLGTESAQYAITPGQSLREALRLACSKVTAAVRQVISNQPPLVKLSDEQRVQQTAMWRFVEQIKGSWWERIRVGGQVEALSFFTITADEVHGAILLDGRAYAKNDGAQRSTWRSTAARLNERMVRYVRECRPDTAWYPGLGEINFSLPGPNGVVEQGEGLFWEGNVSHPESTIIKAVELRRVSNPAHALTMNQGTEAEKADLVRWVLGPPSPVF